MTLIRSPKFTTIVTGLLLLALAACSQTGSQGTRSPQPDTSTTSSINRLIEQARASDSPQAERYLIEAASLLLADNQATEAQQLLSRINPSQLDPDTLTKLALTLADLHIQLNEPVQAEAILTTDRIGILTAANQMNSDQLNAISLKRAQVWELNENFLAAARERIFVAPMLSDDTALSNQQAIWNDLVSIPNDQLKELAGTIAVPEIQAWLELAWIYKGSQDQLDQQLAKLDEWQQRYPGHPAAQQPPEAIRVLRELSANQPQQIALLLPTQGKFKAAARAILDGFMGAYYANRGSQQDGKNITIRVYDTSNTNEFQATYQQAVREGAEIIIGPLQKENLRVLLDSTDALPVTTIALNQEQGQYESPSNLYQFALSPEDDALEVARHSAQKDYQRAAVLFQNNPWWERAYLAFAQQWQTDQRLVTGIASYDEANTMAKAIKDMLLVQNSEQRAAGLRSILGRKVEFQPRRRQDIDFIYLIATPEQARQIRPLLDFYYAQDIPVIAGSQIYTGKSDPKTDRDLNGIEFCDIPWLLEKPDSIHSAMMNAWPEADYRFFRLNAMGVDAYRLQSRLLLLTQIPDAGLFGATGNLSVGIDNKVHRQLSWAIIKNGRPQLLPKIVEPNQDDNEATKAPYAKKAEWQPG